MRASRRSHTISSYGWTPGDVNNRRRPIAAPAVRSDAIDMVNLLGRVLGKALGKWARTAGQPRRPRHSNYSHVVQIPRPTAAASHRYRVRSPSKRRRPKVERISAPAVLSVIGTAVGRGQP